MIRKDYVEEVIRFREFMGCATTPGNLRKLQERSFGEAIGGNELRLAREVRTMLHEPNATRRRALRRQAKVPGGNVVPLRR